MSGVWKFGTAADAVPKIPAKSAIERLRKLVDYRTVQLDPANLAVQLPKDHKIGLGGIAKGYIVDRAASVLKQANVRDFLVQAGGDLFGSGKKPDGLPWVSGIQDPRGPADRSFATIDLSDSTFSTSGDYERAFVKNGRRYHHILDPATGEPSRGCRSVTIMTGSAVLADGLDTGVFVMGPAAGMALLERLHVNGVIVSDRNEVLMTQGLKDQLVLLAPPTDAP